jgi:uncharacterized protein (TIGR02466 family)
MNSNIHNIFSVPIWGYIFNNEKYHSENYIEKIIQLSKTTETVKKSNQYGWQSSDELHKLPVFAEFVKHVNSICNNSLNEIKPNSPKIGITEMWANINYKNSYNHHHIHSGVISGVFYLKIPKNCGRLILVNPAIRSDGNFIRVNNYGVEPIKLACILFPSWLEHYVEPNISDEERISISFNTNFI